LLSAKDIKVKFGDAVALILAGDRSDAPRSLGSGVFVSADGLLVTNLHVVKGYEQVRVVLSTGEDRTTSTVVGYSELHDLVVLKAEGRKTPFVTLGDSEQVSPGEQIVVISNPEGYTGSVSTGVVSEIRTLGTFEKVIQFTAPISHGSSGGGIFNEAGQVIGVVSSSVVDGQNLNFGVPINDVKPLLIGRPTVQLRDLEPATGLDRATAPKSEDNLRIIVLHVGIPGLAYVGQPLQDFVKRFPKAQVMPFAGQDDAVSVKAGEAGITCIAVGDPGDLKLASVGFNLDGSYEALSEGDFRTGQGIGKGSTVNDLLGAYGKPVDILGEQPRGALRRPNPGGDRSLRQKYQYANTDGTVKTYFMVENNHVTQVVVNDLDPLDKHIVKARPKK